MSIIYSHPSFHYSYLLDKDDDDEEEEELIENKKEEVMEKKQENASDYLVDPIIIRNHYCYYCKIQGHCEDNCRYLFMLGHKLHLKALEVREFDIEMECCGNSIKAWMEGLSMYQIKLLAKRINLQSYCSMLFRTGYITDDQSILFNRSNYIIGLQHYYYIKPSYSVLQKKMYFKVGLLPKEERKDICSSISSNEVFECPICIESSIDIKETVQLNCSHDICIVCFHQYIDQLKTNEKPCCSLCREIITNVKVVKEEYLSTLENKYILQF